jgi:hypothetical protein
MSVRTLLNRNGAIVITVIVLVVIAAIAWTVSRMSRRAPAAEQAIATTYYFDLGSKKLFASASGQPSPIVAPSGATQEDGSPGGVLAYVYSCGSCANREELFVAYLEQMSNEGREALAQLKAQDPNLRWEDVPPAGRRGMTVNPDESMLVATESLEGGWVSRESQEGIAIIDDAIQKCGEGKRPAVCRPSDIK